MNIKFAIEKGVRFFEKSKKNTYFTFTLEVPIVGLLTGQYVLDLSSESFNLDKSVFIDLENHKAITSNSHEDPLLEKDGEIYVFFQLDLEQIRTVLLSLNENFKMRILDESGNVLKEYPIEFYEIDLEYWASINQMSLISDYCIKTEKQCVLTLHMTDKSGKYKEKHFPLSSGDSFDFKKYLKDVVYLGVQCTYVYPEIEVEEKFIVIGQKGMVVSGVFESMDGERVVPLLPFKKNYQVLYKEDLNETFKNDEFVDVQKASGWKRLETISELFVHLKENDIKFYEMSPSYLRDTYTEEVTYSNQKIYSLSNQRKPSHVSLELCIKCKMQSKCMQAVPSGLSYLVFKKNIGNYDPEKCEVFQILKAKDID